LKAGYCLVAAENDSFTREKRQMYENILLAKQLIFMVPQRLCQKFILV